MRTALLALAAVGAAALTPVVATPAAAASQTSVVTSFDETTPAWVVASGSASLSTSATHSAGTGSLQVGYDVTSASLELESRATPAPLSTGVPTAFSVDVDGDGTYNTLYVRLRDATGELFYYRLGALSFTGWRTLSVDLTSPPLLHSLGNGDGVLDAPVSLYRFVVDRNSGGLGPTGTLRLDAASATTSGWTLPSSTARVFAPSAGQTTTIGFTAGAAGDWQLLLYDGQRRPRTFSGTAAAPGPVSVGWDGTLDGGAAGRGSVQAVLRHDTTPGDGLDPTPAQVGVPYLTGVVSRYEPAAPGSPAGINSFVSAQSDPKVADAQAALMEDAYLRMAREEFEWKRVEPRQGYFDWAKFDQAVEVLRSHDVSVLGKLVYSAPWASSAPSGTAASTAVYYPPRNVADYAAYARAVVHRYKDRVHVWEIWNEENSAAFWKPAPSASGYAALLKAAYAAIKAEDPTATVVLGGTVGFDKAFLDGLRAAGAWSSFDALGLHAYVTGSPDKGVWPLWLDQASAYLQTYGDKPVWLTEFGWSTCTSCSVATSEADQGRFLARAYLDAAARGVRGIFAYDLVEDTTSTTAVNSNYGLVEVGGRKKPAFESLRRAAAALDQSVVSGRLAPTASSSGLASDLATTSGWTATPLSGGTDSLAATTGRHGGAGGLRLTYNFSGTARGVELKTALRLSGYPTAVSLWVLGDRSAAPVYVKLTDATGETFQGAVGTAGRSVWQRETLYFDGSNANWSHSGGDNDGVVDYPVTLRSVFVYKGSLGITSGTVYLDDLTAHYGGTQRGVVLVGRGAAEQAIYRPAALSVAEPVSGPAAWVHTGSTMTSVAVSGGRATIVAGPEAAYLVSQSRVSTATLTPNGDGVNDRTDMYWTSGDRSVVTEQVLSGATTVRTQVAGGLVDAGTGDFAWDGKVWNGTAWVVAAPGAYLLRVTLTGPDGRTTVLQQSVSLS